MALVDTSPMLNATSLNATRQISRTTLTLSRLPHLHRLTASRFRRTDHERDHRTAQHDGGDHRQSLRVMTCVLADAGDQHGTEDSRETPCGQHQPVNRANVLGAEVVCSECGHGAETTSVAEQNDEAEHSESGETRDARQHEEYDRLNYEH